MGAQGEALGSVARKSWWRHGFLNTLEHGLTRVADASTTLILLWAVSTEVFSKLALAQALIAPIMFFFLSPEVVIYRDFKKWKSEGLGHLCARLRALRLFAWGKGVIALLFATGLALAIPGQSPWEVRFFSVVWAFGLALAPQLCGADREFLRLSLELKTLNWLSLLQKLILFGGTAAVALFFPKKIGLLALVSVLSAVVTMLLFRVRTRRVLLEQGATPEMFRGEGAGAPSARSTLTESFRTFSFWQHLLGVVHGWVLTMDLFFLGAFRFPAREVGLYAAVLKLANFSTALPMALANLFSIWIGRRKQDESERSVLFRYSFYLLLFCVFQLGMLLVLAPYVIDFLSRGRWSPEEQGQMLVWLAWILGGATILSTGFLASAWLSLRVSISRLFLQVYLPWGVLGLAIYAGAVYYGGLTTAAIANVAVMAVHIVLLFIFYKREGPQK